MVNPTYDPPLFLYFLILSLSSFLKLTTQPLSRHREDFCTPFHHRLNPESPPPNTIHSFFRTGHTHPANPQFPCRSDLFRATLDLVLGLRWTEDSLTCPQTRLRSPRAHGGRGHGGSPQSRRLGGCDAAAGVALWFGLMIHRSQTERRRSRVVRAFWLEDVLNCELRGPQTRRSNELPSQEGWRARDPPCRPWAAQPHSGCPKRVHGGSEDRAR